MKKYTKYILILFVFFGFNANAQDNNKDNLDYNQIFETANKYYKSNDYKKALESYREIENINNGYVYYNIGNTYLKLGQNANALASYTKAKDLLPRNENISKNLDYTFEKMSIEKDIFYYIENAIKIFDIKESVITFIILWSLVFIYFFMKKTKKLPVYITSIVNFILIPLSIYFLLSITTRIFEQNKAIIVTKESEIKISNNEQDITLYKLKEGQQVYIIDEINNWYKISSKEGKGWVNKDSVSKLSAI